MEFPDDEASQHYRHRASPNLCGFWAPFDQCSAAVHPLGMVCGLTMFDSPCAERVDRGDGDAAFGSY